MLYDMLNRFAPMMEDDGGAGGEGAESKPNESVEGEKGGEKGKDEKKYTDADVDKILDSKFAKWEAKKQKEIDEAQKLADMNADEKAKFKEKQLQDKIDELQSKETHRSMMDQARNMMKEGGINIGDAVLERIVATTAEETKKSVEEFLKIFEEAVEDGVKEKLKGAPPKGGATPKALTKEEIMAIKDPVARREAIKNNISVFEKKS